MTPDLWPLTFDRVPDGRYRLIVHDDVDGRDGSAVVTTVMMTREQATQLAWHIASLVDDKTEAKDAKRK